MKCIYLNDQEIPDSSIVLENYNPQLQGCAYYVTSHGDRIQDLPSSAIAKTKPDIHDCCKSFPEAARSGTTYLFLRFDPLHGHCYGFHVITMSEGRKDPFASALLYTETPPNDMFYDISCQLEEYALNREPTFWRGCRFYHIFHGSSHTCLFVKMSRRVPSLDIGINSETCEQFNSYVQKKLSTAQDL